MIERAKMPMYVCKLMVLGKCGYLGPGKPSKKENGECKQYISSDKAKINCSEAVIKEGKIKINVSQDLLLF